MVSNALEEIMKRNTSDPDIHIRMWLRFSTATVVHKIDNTEIASDCKKHPIHHTDHRLALCSYMLS